MQRRAFIAGLALAALRPTLLNAQEAPSAAGQAIPISPRRPVNGLQVFDENGAAVLLEAYRGKMVVLNMWATWCLPCRLEMPSLSRLYEKAGKDGIVVLPVAFDWRGVEGVRKFYSELGITNLPVMTGDGDNLKSVLQMTGLPSTAIIDRQSLHAVTVIGEAVWDDDMTVDWLRRLAAS